MAALKKLPGGFLFYSAGLQVQDPTGSSRILALQLFTDLLDVVGMDQVVKRLVGPLCMGLIEHRGG